MYRLVIAEKPSVAQSIAKVIGADQKQDGYLEGNGFLVSWCVGHLVEPAQPEYYNEKYSKWRHEDLPILPKEWAYQVSEATGKQYGILKNLMQRADVESLIEATDAGREGELIFRLVYQQAGCKKPFERLWISSMEDKAIAEGIINLRPGKEYDALYAAALSRERADWIVGMNATRLFSTLYGQTLNVGRVMTPTLAMLVQREAEITAFRSVPFYTVNVTVGGVVAQGERYEDKKAAESCLQEVEKEKQSAVMKNTVSDKQEKAPLLYDLTNLQRDANRIYGFTAQQTLDYTQSLYEKKLVTYPRTDSRFLTEDMEEKLPDLIQALAEAFGYTGALPIHSKQVINNKKVTDHHAIIPTAEVPKVRFGELPAGEQKTLRLITARLLAGVGVPCTIRETTLEFDISGKIYRAKSKTVTDQGWKEVNDWILGIKEEQPDEEQICEIACPDIFKEGRTIPVSEASIKEGKTSPKKHFTEDMLLSAMEHAGAEEMPEDAEHKGIGTPATRAGTIEKLVRIGFVERKGDKKTKYLIPTAKGSALITVIPEEIQSASMTADWEEKLIAIEKGEYDAASFLNEISEMVTHLVETYQAIPDASVMMHPLPERIGTCPRCGKPVADKAKGYFCENKECQFALWKENRFFEALGKKLTKQVAERLIRDGKANLKGCVSRKSGKTYDAVVCMVLDDVGKVSFQLDFARKERNQ